MYTDPVRSTAKAPDSTTNAKTITATRSGIRYRMMHFLAGCQTRVSGPHHSSLITHCHSSLFIPPHPPQRTTIGRNHNGRRDTELFGIKEQQLPASGHLVGVDEDFFPPGQRLAQSIPEKAKIRQRGRHSDSLRAAAL